MKIGTDIQAVCRNCGGDQAHSITALPKPSIAVVACKKCGAEQRYLAAENPAVTPPPIIAVSKPRKATKAKKATTVWGPDECNVEPVMSRPIRPYQLADLYRLGDRIEHRTFGLGVVDEIIGPTKINVFFPVGHRIMMQGQPQTA
jgi:hypothetical protein